MTAQSLAEVLDDIDQLLPRAARGQDRDDLRQETVLRLLRSAHRIRARDRRQVRVFVRTTARNAWIDECRRREQARVRPATDAGVDLDTTATARSAEKPKSFARQLRETLGGTDQIEGLVAEMRLVREMSFVEIADSLGLREDAVRKRWYRWIGRLRAWFPAERIRDVLSGPAEYR